jgi:hypothetical protein
MRIGFVFLLLMACATPEPPVVGPWSGLAEQGQRVDVRARTGVFLKAQRLAMGQRAEGRLAVGKESAMHLEFFDPLGVSLLSWRISEGEMTVRVSRNKTVYRAKDANRVLLETTNGVVNLEGLVQLMMGRFHWLPSEVWQRVPRDRRARFQYFFPEGPRLVMVMDPLTEHIQALAVHDENNQQLLAVRYQWAEGRWPREVGLTLPPLELEIQLGFEDWKTFHAGPDRFAFAPPKGFLEKPMEEAWIDGLEQWASDQTAP